MYDLFTVLTGDVQDPRKVVAMLFFFIKSTHELTIQLADPSYSYWSSSLKSSLNDLVN